MDWPSTTGLLLLVELASSRVHLLPTDAQIGQWNASGFAPLIRGSHAGHRARIGQRSAQRYCGLDASAIVIAQPLEDVMTNWSTGELVKWDTFIDYYVPR